MGVLGDAYANCTQKSLAVAKCWQMEEMTQQEKSVRRVASNCRCSWECGEGLCHVATATYATNNNIHDFLIAYAANNSISDYPDYNHKRNTQTITLEKPKLHVCQHQWHPASIFSNISLDKNFVPYNYIICIKLYNIFQMNALQGEFFKITKRFLELINIMDERRS